MQRLNKALNKYGKKILLSLTTLALMVGVTEVLARSGFAFFVGPKVLLYGTSAFTDARTIPSAIMRKVGYTPPTPGKPVAQYMKFAPHELKFDRDEDGRRFSPTINSRGFRGEEFSEHKKPNVVRVVALGASSAFGYHNRDDETFPYLLEQRLNGAEDEELAFEVINLGIPHITSEQIVSLFIAEALPLEPNIITLYAGLNDSGQGAYQVIEKRGDISVSYEFWRKRLLTLAFFDSYLYYSGIKRFYLEDLRRMEAVNRDRFLASVSYLHEECVKRGILFVVATQQAKSQLIERAEIEGVSYSTEIEMVRDKLRREGLTRRELAFLVHGGVMEGLRDWASANEVRLVDVIAALDGDRSVLLTYVHLSPAGNRLVAGEFAAEILRRLRSAESSGRQSAVDVPL